MKQALIEVGGYSEELSRNQDNDTNQKLRASGHKLLCTWKTQCLYYPKGNIKALLSYGSRNGYWNVISFRKNFASMGARHFIPFIFLMALAFSLTIAILGGAFRAPNRDIFVLPFMTLLGLHLCVGLASAIQVAVRERCRSALWLPLVFLGFHVAYGFGTLLAVVSFARSTDVRT